MTLETINADTTEDEIELTSNLGAELVESMGSDLRVVNAARVSLNQHSEELSDKDAGLIRFLMSNRHACYDAETEVLTGEGWKRWPDVTGNETFVTLDLQSNQIEMQHAQRVISAPFNGSMVHISAAAVDAFVTPNHNLVAERRVSGGWSSVSLIPATEFTERAHRVSLGGGSWAGEIHAPEIAELIGFIAADGHVGTSIEFHLRKTRKIEWLKERTLVTSAPRDRYRLISKDPDLRRWAKDTYTDTGDRCFPREILVHGDKETIAAMLGGYLFGDGSTSSTGKITCSTVSQQLADDIQEAALKAGVAAVQISTNFKRGPRSYPHGRPLHRLTVYRSRNSRPRLGWTKPDREAQVQTVDHEGTVYCVTVPNGTLYVRRNGKPMWSGNSPFEHCTATFLITAPIFVAREWHRHRTQSFNEVSGRYSELKPRFYAPDYDRPLVQTGKPGAYKFEQGDDDATYLLYREMRFSYQTAWYCYQRLLAAGIAKEVARNCLPVGVYTSWYATANLRAWINFLSLRAEEHALWEIRKLAFTVEEKLAALYPITIAEWDKSGRGPL